MSVRQTSTGKQEEENGDASGQAMVSAANGAAGDEQRMGNFKAQADVHVVRMGLFKKWYAQRPTILEDYELVALDEFDLAKYADAAFSTLLINIIQDRISKRRRLSLLSATGQAFTFVYAKRRHDLVTATLEIPLGADADVIMTELARDLRDRCETSQIFFPGEREVAEACTLLGKEGTFPLHAKLEVDEIAAAREPLNTARCIPSTSLGERGTTIPDVAYVMDTGRARNETTELGVAKMVDEVVDAPRGFQRASRASGRYGYVAMWLCGY